MLPNSKVYSYPEYYALAYRWNTEVECEFLRACLERYGPKKARRLLDIGCGAGRHLFQLAEQGYEMAGIDVQPEMIDYIRHQPAARTHSIRAQVDDLHALSVTGPFDAAYCFMDTFRFLLTNEAILAHLRRVAERLAPGGLYVTDFWVPTQWDQIANEVHEWEQTEGERTVRVFYVQDPQSVDPVAQTFEDELVFEVQQNGDVQQIRGGPTRTRLLLPQEFALLVEHSGVFELAGRFSDFDLAKPMGQAGASWRMVSVLRRR